MDESSATAYGVFDCDFGFDSQGWSCSYHVKDALNAGHRVCLHGRRCNALELIARNGGDEVELVGVCRVGATTACVSIGLHTHPRHTQTHTHTHTCTSGHLKTYIHALTHTHMHTVVTHTHTCTLSLSLSLTHKHTHSQRDTPISPTRPGLSFCHHPHPSLNMPVLTIEAGFTISTDPFHIVFSWRHKVDRGYI